VVLTFDSCICMVRSSVLLGVSLAFLSAFQSKQPQTEAAVPPPDEKSNTSNPHAAAPPLAPKETLLWPDYDRTLGKTPTHIIQFGRPRTATSLQYQVLCVILSIIWEGEHVDCRFHDSKWKGHFSPAPGSRQVLKLHKLSPQAKENIKRGQTKLNHNTTLLWMFTTSRGGDHTAKKEVKSMGVPMPFEASLEDLAQRGVHIIYSYQKPFNLSNAEMEPVYEYMRYWGK
jgi:hypothetical protein